MSEQQLRPQQPQIRIKKGLDWYINEAIMNDYLICVLFTSAAEGKLPSLGMDFGAGKSSLMLRMMRLYLSSWDAVFDSLHYFPFELEHFFSTAPRRVAGNPVFFGMDDIQMNFGKERSGDPYLRSLKNRLTTARPQLSVFMATAPDIGQLAKPFREAMNFVVITSERGTYEVHRVKKYVKYNSPYETFARLDYCGESFLKSIKKLPEDVHIRYMGWRDEQNRKFDRGEGEIKINAIRRVLTEESEALLRHIVDKGGLTRQTIIVDLEQRAELKLLKSTGLVEQFGDEVVPTQNAKKIINLLK